MRPPAPPGNPRRYAIIERMLNAGTTAARRAIVWLILAALAGLVTYLAFRGYFSPELLLNFSGTFNC